MSVPAPHFLLYSEAAQAAESAARAARCSVAGPSAAESHVTAGRWRFVLRSPGGETALEAADEEAAASSERLELLAIIRGLEALDQPSKVTLMTGSRDIQRGLAFGLTHWREHDWQWERYGQMTPVKNADLWRRIDRLLEIHDVACRPRRLEKADDLAAPQRATTMESRGRADRVLRIDQPTAKSEGRSSNVEGSPKSNFRSSSTRTRFVRLSFLLSCLFWISSFVLRFFARGGFTAGNSRQC